MITTVHDEDEQDSGRALTIKTVSLHYDTVITLLITTQTKTK